MLKKMLCAFLSMTLLNVASIAQMGSNEEKLKAKIVHWGLQKNVSVQLQSGEKLQGRITEIKDDYFAIQILQQGQIATRQVAFTEVTKLAGATDWNANKARNYIGLIGAIGLAVFVAVKLTQSNDPKPKTIIFSSR